MTTTSWEIYVVEDEEQDRVYVSSRDGDVKELLGKAVAMWTRDFDPRNWEGAETMAAICFYYSDLTEREILSIFGTSGEGNYPGEPGWELPHPEGGTMRVEKERE